MLFRLELQKNVDTLLVIPNQNLFLVAKAETTFKEAFMLADEVLQQGVRSITDLMVMPGLINLDFADIRSVMNEMGKAMMGTGEGEGQNRALEAAERAIANPLLDGVSMQGAKGVIISIIGGEDMKLLEVDEAANHIRELVDPDANIIWGSAFNPELEGRIRVSVVATGIDASAEQKRAATPHFDLGGARGPRKPMRPSASSSTQQSTSSAPLDVGTSEMRARPGVAGGRGMGEEPVSQKLPDPADDSALVSPGSDGGFANEATNASPASAYQDDRSAEDEPLELTADLEQAGVEPEQSDETMRTPSAQDELVLGAEAPDGAAPSGQDSARPRRPRLLNVGAANEDENEASAQRQSQPQSQPQPAKTAPPSGSTLFERMANMSRKATQESGDGEDQRESSSVMRIPRFLGRQNNQ